jgi:uncharacterized protein (DUF4415 family)
MKKEYDLKKMKSRKNPYANRLRKQITIRLDTNTIEYFKELAGETGFSYQALINLYLRDCAENHKKLHLEWIKSDLTNAKH